MKRPLQLLLLLLPLVLAACNTAPKDELNVALQELDKAIGIRSELTALKNERIALKRKALEGSNLSYGQRMEIMEELIDEYDKYQLDSTIQWTWRAI